MVTFAVTSSGRVVSIDSDVFLTQVAAPGLRHPLAQPELSVDLDLRPLEGGADGGQVDRLARAAGEDSKAGDAEVEAIYGQLRPAVAEGTHDAAPVGVAAVDGRFDQAGAGDRAGCLARILGRGAAGDVNRDQLGRPLAVAGDLAGEVPRHRQQRLLQLLGFGRARRDGRVAGGAVG